MPSSDEVFGGLPEPMLPNLDASKGQLPPGMFPNIVAQGYSFEPDKDEYDKQMDAIRYEKILKLKDIQILTFDFSKEEDVNKYRDVYAKLYPKIAAGAIVFHCHERMQINDTQNPRWILHMEYSEYELIKTDITESAEKKPDKETKNGSEKRRVPQGTA